MNKITCYRCGKYHAIRNCLKSKRRNKQRPNWKKGTTEENFIKEERFRKMMQIEDGFWMDEVEYYDDDAWDNEPEKKANDYLL